MGRLSDPLSEQAMRDGLQAFTGSGTPEPSMVIIGGVFILIALAGFLFLLIRTLHP